VAAGETLPFRDAQFDGLFLINVIEHVADLEAVLRECARVLDEDGLWLAITPNGNWEFWLDLAERWSLKIPEGPHTFLTPQRLRLCAQNWFEVLEHRTFLVLPVGPPGLAGFIDSITFCAAFGGGFFQFVVAKKRLSRFLPGRDSK
jgi:SAM-dependent methyltransferase